MVGYKPFPTENTNSLIGLRLPSTPSYVETIWNGWSLRRRPCSSFLLYSQLSNKSTGTMVKNLPKSLVVLTFSCGTIGMNSRFLLVVLLFQRYYRVNFGRFKLEINRNEHYLLWKWYIKVSLIHINLMCMIEGWLHWS